MTKEDVLKLVAGWQLPVASYWLPVSCYQLLKEISC